jgi:transposase
VQRLRELPGDVESLTKLVLEQQAALEIADAALLARQMEVEKLKIELLRLKRMRFGRSSEQLDQQIAQLELTLEDLEVSQTQIAPLREPAAIADLTKPSRRPLPANLPRETQIHASPCACPECGGELRSLGEDVAEILEYEPARFKVIRHVRPKFSCANCQTIIQTPAPNRPIARGMAGPGLLAHVLVSKYCDHLPLYRQSEIYAREGVELDRSALADWVGHSSALLTPLVTALNQYVLSATKVHADDTPVPVLCPGRGTTRQGRLWTYVRDDRPSGSNDPAAVWFAYSPDRKGEHPRRHLKDFRGTLQADGYAGFDKLYNDVDPNHPIKEAACCAQYPESGFIWSRCTMSLQ